MISTDPTLGPAQWQGPKAERILSQARQLESMLFAEMLKASGTGQPGMGGEDSPFEGFLRTAQAEAVASAGQTGLAEAIVSSLLRRG